MAKFRVEVTETVTTVREAWFEAEDQDDAKAQAEAEDWRDWEEVSSHADCAVSEVEAEQ